MDIQPELIAALDSYQMNAEAREVLRETPLALFVGPTASGRNTLIKKLNESDRYHFLVSATTRQPRMNEGVMEQDGVEYHFVTQDEMRGLLERGEMLEAKLIHGQQVSGTPISEFERAQAENKTVLGEITTEGVAELIKVKPDLTAIFVIPPDYAIWMERLDLRGAPDPTEWRRRLSSARNEIETALSEPYYRLLINGDLDAAAAHAQAIIDGEKNDDTAARKVAAQLLEEVKKHLEIED